MALFLDTSCVDHFFKHLLTFNYDVPLCPDFMSTFLIQDIDFFMIFDRQVLVALHPRVSPPCDSGDPDSGRWLK